MYVSNCANYAMPKFYHSTPLFNTLEYMSLGDADLLSFIRRNHFSPNHLWDRDNPLIHCWLANEFFDHIERLLKLTPERIDPNLCDGETYGSKSILILLSLLPSSGALVLEFIDQYKPRLKFDYQDKYGRTALHYAVILGRDDLVASLIACGASTTVEDTEKRKPFDYLHSSAELISSTLKTVDIEPSRDIRASRNMLVNHRKDTIIINGQHVAQTKEIIDDLLARDDLVFIQYISPNEGVWGAFIGDNSPATHDRLLSLAKDIASGTGFPLSDIFVNKIYPEDECDKLHRMLKMQSIQFSGISVLERCIEGHMKIERDLLAEKPTTGL